MLVCFFLFFKQKTAYEMRISDWSSDVCSSDLRHPRPASRTQIARNWMHGKCPWTDWWLHEFPMPGADDRYPYGKTLPAHCFRWWPTPGDVPAGPCGVRYGRPGYCRNCLKIGRAHV